MEGELTADEAGRVFDQLPTLDAVQLTGGEPFVRQDLGELADSAQKKLRPAVLSIATNGILTDRIARFCEQRHKGLPLQIVVSLNGHGGAARNNRHGWRDAAHTVRILARHSDALRVRVAVHQTVHSADDAEQYRRLRDKLRPLGVRHELVLPDDAAAPGRTGGAASGALSKPQLRALLDEVEADLDSYPVLERMGRRYHLRGVRERLLGAGETEAPPCVALNAHVRLLANGDLSVCQFNTRIAGNLREQSFDDIWRSRKADQLRGWVAACTGCWAHGQVMPNATHSGDLLRKSLPVFGGTWRVADRRCCAPSTNRLGIDRTRCNGRAGCELIAWRETGPAVCRNGP